MFIEVFEVLFRSSVMKLKRRHERVFAFVLRGVAVELKAQAESGAVG
jgi:hypothetical protein